MALERFYKNDIYNYISDKQATWQSNVDRFNFKGVYSLTTQYYQNTMVNYTTTEGTFLYLCIKQPDTGILPTDTNYWRVLTLRGERGLSGEGLVNVYRGSGKVLLAPINGQAMSQRATSKKPDNETNVAGNVAGAALNGIFGMMK